MLMIMIIKGWVRIYKINKNIKGNESLMYMTSNKNLKKPDPPPQNFFFFKNKENKCSTNMSTVKGKNYEQVLLQYYPIESQAKWVYLAIHRSKIHKCTCTHVCQLIHFFNTTDMITLTTEEGQKKIRRAFMQTSRFMRIQKSLLQKSVKL